MKKDEKKASISASEMTDKDMRDILVELQDTNYWVAITALIAQVDTNAINTLASVDPFKEPTLTARTQGQRMGLYYIRNFIESEVKRRKDGDKEAENKGK